MQNFKCYFIVMFTSLLIKTHLHIIWKTEAVTHLFLSLHICCTILLSCRIAQSWFISQVKHCLGKDHLISVLFANPYSSVGKWL